MSETIAVTHNPSQTEIDVAVAAQHAELNGHLTEGSLPHIAGAPVENAPLSSPPNEVGPPADDRDWEKLLQTRVIDMSSGVVNNSHDYADNELNRLTTQRGVRGFIKRVVWGNVLRDYKRLSLINHGRAEQIESGNIHANIDGSQAQHDETAATVVQKFATGYIHEGEREDSMASVEHGQEFEDEIKGLVLAFASGSLDHDALIEERTRIVDSFGAKLKADDRNKGLLFADNILDVAQNAKAAFDHNVGLDRIEAMLTTYKGEARTGARTEVNRTTTDRIVDKLYQTKVGSLVNETTISAVVGAVMVVNKFATRKVLSAAGAFLTMGASAAFIAGIREHSRIGQERQTFLRDRATGDGINHDIPVSKRTEKLEESRYETVAASELHSQLTIAREAVDASQPMTMSEALNSIAAIETRIKLSDHGSIDLIDYTSKITLEQERMGLDIALAEAKVALKRALESASDEQLAGADLESRDINELVTARGDTALEMLGQDVSVKDRAFNKLRLSQTLKMGAIGFATGVVFGEAIQEARAAFDPQLRGLSEEPKGDQTRQTLLSGLFHGGAQNIVRTPASSELFKLDPSGTTNIANGYHITKLPDGTFSLYNPSDHAVGNHFNIGSNGRFDAAGQDALRGAGFTFTEQVADQPSVSTVNTTEIQSPGEYLQSHPAEFTSLHRELWYDNNTSAFDKNEMRMDWGGNNGTGMDANGNYSFNVQHMMPDGSYHDGVSANAQELIKSGTFKVALSMTKGSQTRVFMVPVDARGNAIINAKSYIGRSLFSNENGRAKFIGAYAEAAQITGVNAKGETTARILATVVGDNQPKVASVTTPHIVVEHNQVFTNTIGAPEVNNVTIPTEIPFVLPLYSRRGVDPLTTLESEENQSYNYVENYAGDQARRTNERTTPFSPELENDPDANPDANKVTKRYLRAMRPSYRRVVERLNDQLDKQPRARAPRTVVMIPAAAHQEGKNIYTTLEQYGRQEGIDPEEFEVVVFANNPTGTKRDDTIKEVKRFQKTNPAIKVRLIDRELEPENAKIGYVRKAMADAVLTDYQRRGIDLNDVLLVTNDADSHWINPKYVKTMREKADANPDTDAFLGFLEWGHDAYKAYPEILAGTRFMQVLDIQLRMQGRVASSGANFAFRPGTYSAVGGYIQNRESGEDVALGKAIRSARNGSTAHTPIKFAGMSTAIQTSARRAVDVLLKDGSSPAGQWREFGPNDALRTNRYSMKPFDFDDPAAVATMVSSTEAVLNHTLKIYGDSFDKPDVQSYNAGRITTYDDKTVRTLTRLLGGQGIEVRWNADGTFAIIDSSRMVQKMRSFQATH